MSMRHIAPFQLKAIEDDGVFSGYGSVFGVRDSDGDIIMPGAFTKTIARANETGRLPKMLWQHQIDTIIGKFTAMREDDYGLFVQGSILLEIEKGREAYALMKAGVLDGMSIGFNIIDGQRGADGRMITEVDLWEVSLVTWGANPAALVTNVKAKESIRDFEAFLREAGFSRREAVAIAASGYKALRDEREARDESEQETAARLKNLITVMES